MNQDKNEKNKKRKYQAPQRIPQCLLLSLLLLTLSTATTLAQICDGTQWRTDRGLVYLKKGETQTLLIGGVWYRCTGCGDCVPVSPTRQTQPRQPIIERRGSGQELSDEQIIELIERTKALTAPVQAEDEARLQAESRAFQDRLPILIRDLKSLPDDPIPQFKALKLKLQELAEKATTVKEMANIAYWSLYAAWDCRDLECAKEISGWGFDEWNSHRPAPDLSQLTVDVPVPETQTPQFIAFKYISDWAADMHTKIVMLFQRAYETRKKSVELESKSRDMMKSAIVHNLDYTEEGKKERQLSEDLLKQAKALEKEAGEMASRAIDYINEVSKMQRELYKLIDDPSSCQAFLEKHSVKK